MDVRRPFFQHIALIVAGVMFLNPIVATAAQLTVDAQAGGNASVGQAGNGVPIVNIATPTGSGLSHNKFSDYNVGQQGLILNNASERLHNSQLGGIIVGNPNLQGGAANVILNEVTGSNRSQLKGYTEVAGQAARVIVANPHGITCDGCGFINTPRATLSTGAPVVEDGRLSGFDVDGGDIVVEGAGLNASNVDQFELITRSAQINAEIHANRLSVVAGRNAVDAETLEATAKADDGRDKPQVAIDSSALGGMYAGAIRLVGTEAGVGVKLAGDLAASAGDIRIGANGQLTVANAAASGQIAVQAAQVETQGQVYAGTQLDVRAQGNLANHGSLAARDRVALSSGATLETRGHVEAGVNADNSRNKAGSVELAGQQVRNAGSVVASRDVDIDAKGALDNRDGQLLAEGDTRVEAGQLNNQQGRIVADGRVDLVSEKIDNAQGRVSAGEGLEIRATQLAQQAGVLSSGGRLNIDLAGGHLDNRGGLVNAEKALRLDNVGQLNNGGGEISSRQSVQLAVADLDNQHGKLLAETTLALAGENLDNRSGRIAANGALSLATDGIDNRGGRLSGQSGVTLDTTFLDNGDHGQLLGAHLALTAERLSNRNQGLIHGEGSVLVRGAWLDNSDAALTSGGDLRVELVSRAGQSELDGRLLNAGGLLGSEGALSVSAGRLDNRQGELSSAAALTVNALGSLDNRDGRLLGDSLVQLRSSGLDNGEGLISAGTTLDLLAGQVANRDGRILATQSLLLSASGLDQQGGVLASQGSLSLDLHGGTLNNDGGLLNAPGALVLNNLGTLSNRDGEISSRQGFTLAASTLDNQAGRVLSEQNLALRIQSLLDNQTGLVRANGLDLSAARLENAAGRVSSRGDLVAEVGSLNQVAGELLAEGALRVTGEILDNRSGLLAANGGLTLRVGEIDNRGGEISSQAKATLDTSRLDNSDHGQLLAAHLTLTAERLFNRNQGLIYGRDETQVQGAHLDNTAGTLASDKRLTLELTARAGDLERDGRLVNDAGLVSSEGRLSLGTASLDNRQGRIEGQGATTVSSGVLDNTQGKLIALDRLDLVAEQVSNGHGRIAATGPLVLRATGLDQQGGELFSQHSLSLDLGGGALNNDAGLLNTSGVLLLSNLGAVRNRGGEISSSEGFTLAAGSLDNDGGKLLSAKKLTLRVQGTLSNLVGLVSANGLDLAAARLENGAGRVSSRGDLIADVGSLNQTAGELLAEGTLHLTGQTLDNRDGLLAANGELLVDVADIDNRGGEISSQARASLESRRLDNSDGGQLLAAHLNITSERLLNRNQGLIYGREEARLTGARLDNGGGSAISDQALLIELAAQAGNAALDGRLLNNGGQLGSEGSLTLSVEGLDNTRGSLSTAGTLQLTSQGQVLNQAGRVLSDAGLLLRSTGLDNRSGLISAAGVLKLATGAFDNSDGRLSGGAALHLQAGQLSNARGRIAASGPLVLRASSLAQQDGELFSQSSLALDLQGGALNNDGGFINAPGALSLNNLGAVSNRGGEISSRSGFSLAATSLDNAAGKLISEQDLSVTLDGSLDNRGGSLAGRQVYLAAAALDNSADGLLRSQAALGLEVSGAVVNRGGSLLSGARLDLRAAGLDNSGGQIASQGDLVAEIGQLTQVDGELLAEGALQLTGERLDNQHGLIAANAQLKLTVDEVDNRAGEISSRAGATLLSTTLDNSDGGRLLAAHLNLTAGRLLNRNLGHVYGKDGLRLTGAHLDNAGGTVASDTALLIALTARAGNPAHDGQLLNAKGLLSSEGVLEVNAARIDNTQGGLSSAGALHITSQGVLSNQRGQVLTDAGLILRSAGLDNHLGRMSAVQALELVTGAFDNTQGRLSGGATLDLQAGQVDNAQGRIASSGALVASLTGLQQQDGELFSQSRLALDLNGGALNNDGGLLHAPGQLLLNNLGAVSNRQGEMSSSQGFVLAAQSLDNTQGRLLSERNLSLRIQGVLDNLAGLISAQGIDLRAGSLANGGGSLFARSDLDIGLSGTLDNAGKGLIQGGGDLLIDSAALGNAGGTLLAGNAMGLTVSGAVDNRDAGLINSQGTLTLDAASLDSSRGGEVSAKGDLALTLGRLTQQQGTLIGASALTLDLRQGELDNQQGLIASNGPLTLSNLRDLDNRGGEISSFGILALAAASLDNRGGRLISRDWLRLALGNGDNRSGLLSGWQGLRLTGTDLDNRQLGTLSSRDGDLDVQLAGALLNSGEGALVAGGRLDVAAASLDNSDRGILSSGAGQHLRSAQDLDNRGGQIDAAQALVIDAGRLSNTAGLLLALQDLTFSGTELDNAGGRISASGATRLAVDGTLDNAAGQLASGGPLRIDADVLNNQGGTLASQGSATLGVASFDNSDKGTLAANGALEVDASGAIDNHGDGLIYSRDAGVILVSARLDNSAGAIQGQSDLTLDSRGDVLNLGGTLQSRAGAVELSAASLDNRQGTLASLEGWVRTRLDGWLRNGASGQGGLIQGQRLDLLAAGNLDNTAGRIHALGGAATLQAGAFDNQGGVFYAQGDLLLSGGDLDNRGGKVGAADITLEHSASAVLSNQQGIVESRGGLRVRGANLNNQGGQLRAFGTGGSTFFALGGLLDNRGGTLETASHDLTLSLGSLANQDGQLMHAGAGEFGVALAQVAGAGGRFVTQGGLTLKADSWSNDSILQAGHLTLEVGSFEQTASGQLLATHSFSGKGGTWVNHGLIASDGNLSLDLSGSYSGDGRLSSLGDLDFKAASLTLPNLASITAGGSATFALGGALLNQGRLTAAAELILSAASLSNQGTLGSAGRLTLTTPSLVNEDGLLFSGADMALYVDTFSNRYADVYSLGDLFLARDAAGQQASHLENLSATLEALGNMTLQVGILDNKRDHLLVESGIYSARIDERFCVQPGVDCSGKRSSWFEITQRDRLQVSAASAMSQIVAGGDLRIEGDVLTNSSSLISAGGDLFGDLGQLDNSGVEEGEIETTRMFRLVRMDGKYIVRHQNNARSFTQQYWHESDGYDPQRVDEIAGAIARIISDGDFEQELHSYGSRKVLSSGDQRYAGIIQAGGDIAISATQSIGNGVTRPASTHAISGNRSGSTDIDSAPFVSISLNAQLPPDLAQQQVNPLTLPGFSLPSGQNGLFRLSGQSGSGSQVREAASGQQWSLASTTLEQMQRQSAGGGAEATAVQIDQPGGLQVGAAQLQTSEREQAGLPGQSSVIQLGDQPLIQVAPGLVGSTIAGGSSTDVLLDDTEVSSGPRETVDRAAIDALSSTEVTIAPAGSQAGEAEQPPRAQGLAVSPLVQPHKYLIETNPALTELNRFLSSDYMLDLLGYDPDQAQKRLGDGLYEQRLIREAIVARTGQRFIAGLDSDEAMFRYLMNNAIASQSALNLGLGVSLSAEQVAALTHDIVWMEEQQVLGEKVLVPVLYLAQAEGRLAPNGALIQGRDVTLISGGDLSNQGTLRASGALDVQAVNIANSGLLQASERLQLLAEDSIRNAQGGIIAGRDVSLVAGNDIVNERTANLQQSGLGDRAWATSFVDSAARIEASDSLSLAAGRDVSNLGGVLGSRGDLTIEAGRDVTIASVQDVQHQSRGSSFLNERVSQLGAEVSAGRDLQVSAGRDLGVVASQVTAGRDLDLGAGRDLVLSSAADESHTYFKSKKVTASNDRITQQSSEILAGRDISLGAGSDLSLIASRVKAGNDVDIDAGQDINILSAKDESASYYFKKSKGSFGRSKSEQKESYDSTNIASVIEAGNDLSLNTSTTADGGLSLDGGRDVTVIGSRLVAGNDLTLGATGDIAVLSGVEEHGSYSKKTKSGFLGLSKSGKSQLQTTATQVASELEAGNDVVVAAGSDLRLRASTVAAGNDVELRAGLIDEDGDINLVAANDEAYSRSESYRKKFGLSASDAFGLAIGTPSWGGDIAISSAKKSGQEITRSTNVGSQVNAERDASLIAERDINVVGSGVSAGRNVLLDAGRDVNVVAGSSSEQVTSWKNTKTVGLQQSADGNGFTTFVGAEALKNKTRTAEQTAAASQIAAGLDLDVRAGRDILQQGSDLSAGYDLNMKAGRDILIDAANEQSTYAREQSQKRTGTTTTVNHNFERTKDAISGAGEGENTVSQASSILKAVDSVSQFMSGPTFDGHLGSTSQSQSVSQTVVGNRASTLEAGNDINLVAGNNVVIDGSRLQAGRDIAIKGTDVSLGVAQGEYAVDAEQQQGKGGIKGGTSGGFKLGVGGSTGTATQAERQGTSSPSELLAGRDLNLEASNDLSLVGTRAQSGRDINLNAGNDLLIGAAQNQSSTDNDRRNAGGEVGVTVGSDGFGVYVSASLGKGKLDREGEQMQNAYLYAGRDLNFASGRDTRITGAHVEGENVKGEVGRNLTVSSVPDTGKASGNEYDVSATVTIGYGVSVSGSVGFGETSGKTDWVNDQTRVIARDLLDIRTEEHTQLDGAVIASQAGNLKLDTDTLGFRDIQGEDRERSYYLNAGGSYGSGQQDKSQVGKGEEGQSGWSLEGYEYEREREQTVRATVGEGEIVVRRDAETGSDSTVGLNRDVNSAYEITKDEESRTDLYVSKSSIEALSDPMATVEQWAEALTTYDETAVKNFEQIGIGLNVSYNRLEKALGRQLPQGAEQAGGAALAETALEALLLSGKSLKEAKVVVADSDFQSEVLAQLQAIENIPPESFRKAQEQLTEIGATSGRKAGELLVLSDSTVTYNGLQQVLDNVSAINAYLEANPEQVQAVGLVLVLAQGPKGIMQMAVEQSLSATEIGQGLENYLLGLEERLGQVIAEKLDGGELDPEGNDYLIGGGKLLGSILGGGLPVNGGKSSKTKIEISVESPGSKGWGKNTGENISGGAHRDTSKPKNDGFESHHCPAKGCYVGAPISTLDGPAIKMEPGDHRLTASYGSSNEAKAYRAKQEQLLKDGKLHEAIQMDIDDIRSKFGDKYDSSIDQMLKYADSLDADQFINR